MKQTFLFLTCCAISLSISIAQPVSEDANSKLAATLAAMIANQATKEKYNKTPFIPSDDKAILSKGRWHWKSTKGYGNGDIQVIISFSIDGSHQKVDIQELISEPRDVQNSQ